MDNEHPLVTWSRTWMAAEVAKGRAFEDIRHQFNAASTLLVSLFNAVATTDQDETLAVIEALTRAYARADAMADD